MSKVIKVEVRFFLNYKAKDVLKKNKRTLQTLLKSYSKSHWRGFKRKLIRDRAIEIWKETQLCIDCPAKGVRAPFL